MKEDIVDAAIREVEEETNIKTKFESIISGKILNILFTKTQKLIN